MFKQNVKCSQATSIALVTCLYKSCIALGVVSVYCHIWGGGVLRGNQIPDYRGDLYSQTLFNVQDASVYQRRESGITHLTVACFIQRSELSVTARLCLTPRLLEMRLQSWILLTAGQKGMDSTPLCP